MQIYTFDVFNRVYKFQQAFLVFLMLCLSKMTVSHTYDVIPFYIHDFEATHFALLDIWPFYRNSLLLGKEILFKVYFN